jgi:hypothetical protein
VEYGHAAVAGYGQAGLDLFEVGSAVLGMAVPRLDETGLDVVVGAVQRDRGHVPVQAGHVDAERGDRGGAHRPDNAVQPGRDGIQSAANAVVVQHGGVDAEDLGHRPLGCQSSMCTSGAGEVSRLATSASITWPWDKMATSRMGQTRSTMPARSSRRQNSAITGSAPSVLSALGGP